jgi:hypothetical protein
MMLPGTARESSQGNTGFKIGTVQGGVTIIAYCTIVWTVLRTVGVKGLSPYHF